MKTVDDIVETLDGTVAVAKKHGVSGPAVSMWRKRGYIPARFADAIRADLRKLGIERVPPRLFGMVEGRK